MSNIQHPHNSPDGTAPTWVQHSPPTQQSRRNSTNLCPTFTTHPTVQTEQHQLESNIHHPHNSPDGTAPTCVLHSPPTQQSRRNSTNLCPTFTTHTTVQTEQHQLVSYIHHPHNSPDGTAPTCVLHSPPTQQSRQNSTNLCPTFTTHPTVQTEQHQLESNIHHPHNSPDGTAPTWVQHSPHTQQSRRNSTNLCPTFTTHTTVQTEQHQLVSYIHHPHNSPDRTAPTCVLHSPPTQQSRRNSTNLSPTFTTHTTVQTEQHQLVSYIHHTHNSPDGTAPTCVQHSPPTQQSRRNSTNLCPTFTTHTTVQTEQHQIVSHIHHPHNSPDGTAPTWVQHSPPTQQSRRNSTNLSPTFTTHTTVQTEQHQLVSYIHHPHNSPDGTAPTCVLHSPPTQQSRQNSTNLCPTFTTHPTVQTEQHQLESNIHHTHNSPDWTAPTWVQHSPPTQQSRRNSTNLCPTFTTHTTVQTEQHQLVSYIHHPHNSPDRTAPTCVLHSPPTQQSRQNSTNLCPTFTTHTTVQTEQHQIVSYIHHPHNSPDGTAPTCVLHSPPTQQSRQNSTNLCPTFTTHTTVQTEQHQLVSYIHHPHNSPDRTAPTCVLHSPTTQQSRWNSTNLSPTFTTHTTVQTEQHQLESNIHHPHNSPDGTAPTCVQHSPPTQQSRWNSTNLRPTFTTHSTVFLMRFLPKADNLPLYGSRKWSRRKHRRQSHRTRWRSATTSGNPVEKKAQRTRSCLLAKPLHRMPVKPLAVQHRKIK